MTKQVPKPERRNAKGAKAAPPSQPKSIDTMKKAEAVPTTGSQGRSGTKQATVIGLLRKGTTVAAIMKQTDWQKHSVHGFLAGVVREKLGLSVVSDGPDGKRVYRITAGASSRSGRKASPSRRAD